MSEWSVVTKNDKRRVARSGRRAHLRNCEPPSQQHQVVTESWTNEMKNKAVQQIFSLVEQLKGTDFHQQLQTQWNVMISGERSEMAIEKIVCYGIGNFAVHLSAAMWQFAGALCLRDFLQGLQELRSSSEESRKTKVDMSFFDPCTTTMESHILEELEIENHSTNERGKHPLNNIPTLFFMPHCPVRLYGNVLWANWNVLDLVFCFGNSLRTYHERTIGNHQCEISPLIQFIQEEPVSCSTSDLSSTNVPETAFNDSFLTWFEGVNSSSLPPRPEEYHVPKEGEGELL